ncbi:MAG: alpha/beta fold hydrolase [Chloroflexia bacterium]
MAERAQLSSPTSQSPANRIGVTLAWLVGATLATAAAAFYRRPFATARALRRLRLLASGATERRALVRDLPIRYFESGPRDRPPLVLLHGLGDSGETWAGIIPTLARDHRVIAPDLAGFGQAPIPPEGMHFSVLTDYLARFLETIGIDRAVIIGNSLGGAIAMRHAALHPERVARLFLLNTAGLPIDHVEVFSPRTRAEASALAAASLGAQRRLPGFILDDLVRRVADPARRAYLDSPERTDVTADLPRLTMPITTIWGERDRLIPLAAIAPLRAAHPTAELVTLPNAGHIPQSDAPRDVAALILERLREPFH